jgi:large subunit ribosomal protein L9
VPAQQVKTTLEGCPSGSPSAPARTAGCSAPVTVADVAAALKAAGGPDVDKRRIEVSQPIKSTGEHKVTVRLHPEVSATVTVEVHAS